MSWWSWHVNGAAVFNSLMATQKNRLYESTWFHKFAIVMGPTGYIALLAGWVTTEVGRQPWVVYGVLRTKMRYRIP